MSAKPNPRTARQKRRAIERIYLLCHARDLWLAKISITSIRHWYPDVPVTLIKDRTLGDFIESLQHLQRLFRLGLGAVDLELLVPVRDLHAQRLLDASQVGVERTAQVRQAHVVGWGEGVTQNHAIPFKL